MVEPILDKLKRDLREWLHKFGIEKDLEKYEKNGENGINGNIENYITAFTHPSYKGMFPNAEDYERYEFLGDSVLDLISAEELFFEQNFSEGVMTEKRKLLVNNDYLAQIYDSLKISKLTRTAPNYIPSTKDRANYVEAFFGALFIETNYEKCKDVWDKIQAKMGINTKKTNGKPLNAEESRNQTAMKEHYQQLGLIPKNAKSSLQELCQKLNRPIPEYRLIEQSGPDHDPNFKVEVFAGVFLDKPQKIRSATGQGKSKKIAELKAAEALCEEIFLDFIPSG